MEGSKEVNGVFAWTRYHL